MEAVDVEDSRVNLEFHGDSVHTRSTVDANGSVPAVAIRKVIDRIGGSVDFVKIDCEGAEWRLWQDYESWKNVKYLSAEYHLQKNHSHDEAGSIVADLGFKILVQERADVFGLIRAIRADLA